MLKKQKKTTYKNNGNILINKINDMHSIDFIGIFICI